MTKCFVFYERTYIIDILLLFSEKKILQETLLNVSVSFFFSFEINKFYILPAFFSLMDSQRSSLVVAIQSAEFAKDFHYFLTVNFEGDQEKVLLSTLLFTQSFN